MRTILCDVDDVVAEFIPEWCRRINGGLGSNLSPSDFKAWDLREFLTPAESAFAYSLLRDPNFYERVPAKPGACWGVDRLRSAGHRVVFVTASNDVSAGQKMRWLHLRGMLDAADSRDLIVAKDKTLIRGDILVDDGVHNVRSFPGHTILFDAQHNQDFPHPYRVTSWTEIPQMVSRILGVN